MFWRIWGGDIVTQHPQASFHYAPMGSRLEGATRKVFFEYPTPNKESSYGGSTISNDQVKTSRWMGNENCQCAIVLCVVCIPAPKARTQGTFSNRLRRARRIASIPKARKRTQGTQANDIMRL
jgi:hypothetical protein